MDERILQTDQPRPRNSISAASMASPQIKDVNETYERMQNGDERRRFAIDKASPKA
jgi:D-arabinose 1-dehydrogenase-like Zn-dependent alcohol dehydrogenase